MIPVYQSAPVRSSVLAAFALVFACIPMYSQAAPALTASLSGSSFKVIRSVSGAAGHEDNGRYVMEDPRSVFVVGKDKKVIVYFEWEGPAGPHHFEGLWKGPEGKTLLISDFSYEAKGPRFTGYWSLILSEGTPSGEWNLEARIDGEAAGTHSFMITGSPSATSTSSAPRMLSSSDLYQKALDASVTISRIDGDGAVLGKGAGFWIGDGRILTAFDVIDGAASLRISLQDGAQVTTDQVLAWNRWQDWALLKVERAARVSLKPGSKEPLKVGDRCVFLEVSPAGAKLADGSITGKNSFPKAGDRVLVASGVASASYGGPLLDGYGNYVGILGGNIVPGGDPVKILSLLNDPGANSRIIDWETTGLAVPSSVLPEFPASASVTRLADLVSRGEFLAPVVKFKSIQFAALAGAIIKTPNSMPTPTEYKQVFSHRDNKVVLYISWQPPAKEKLNMLLRLFNADNKMFFESKPREISLAPGRYMTTTWDMAITAIPAGIYRVDLILNDKTAWREFFRISE